MCVYLLNLHSPGLALLNVLRLPLSILPIALTSYKEALKSHARVKTYLNSPEAKILQLNNTDDDTLVDIKNASLSWTECPSSETNNELIASLVDIKGRNKMEAVLRDVTLQIRKGEFIALVGEVGSGKVRPHLKSVLSVPPTP